MSEETPPAATGESALSDIAASATAAIRKGKHDAEEVAAKTLPVMKRALAKGTYRLCYYLAFGATYTGEIALELFPEDSPVRYGFRDGNLAAREARAQKRKSKRLP